MAITFVGRSQANGASTPLTITVPAGTRVGDVMVVSATGNNTTASAPGGFTQIGATLGPFGGLNMEEALFWGVYSGSNPSFSFGNSTGNKAVMRVYRGVNNVKATDATNGGGTGSVVLTFNIPALAATATANEWYAAFWSADNGSLTGPGDLVNTTADGAQWPTFDGDKAIAAAGTVPGAETGTSTLTADWAARAVTLIADPLNSQPSWPFWSVGAGLTPRRDASDIQTRAIVFQANLQHQDPPAPRTPGAWWQWWTEPGLRLGQEGDRQARLAAIEPYALWYRNQPPAPGTPGEWWQFWQDLAQLRQRNEIAQQSLRAQIFLSNLQYWAAPLPQTERYDWQLWQDLAQIRQGDELRQQSLRARAFLVNLQHWGIPSRSEHEDWQFWTDLARLCQERDSRAIAIAAQLFQRNLQHWGIPPPQDVRADWQFWLRSQPVESNRLFQLNSRGGEVVVVPGGAGDPIVVWRHRAGMQ